MSSWKRAQEPADLGPSSVIQIFWYRTVIQVTSQQFFGCFTASASFLLDQAAIFAASPSFFSVHSYLI